MAGDVRAVVLVTAVLAIAACTVPPPAAGAPGPGACSVAPFDARAPSPRANATLAFDVDRRVMVLFGGGTSSAVEGFHDTWTWDGQAWTQQHPAHSPPGTSYAAMAYDVIHHQMVLYEPGRGESVPPQTWTDGGRFACCGGVSGQALSRSPTPDHADSSSELAPLGGRSSNSVACANAWFGRVH